MRRIARCWTKRFIATRALRGRSGRRSGRNTFVKHFSRWCNAATRTCRRMHSRWRRVSRRRSGCCCATAAIPCPSASGRSLGTWSGAAERRAHALARGTPLVARRGACIPAGLPARSPRRGRLPCEWRFQPSRRGSSVLHPHLPALPRWRVRWRWISHAGKQPRQSASRHDVLQKAGPRSPPAIGIDRRIGRRPTGTACRRQSADTQNLLHRLKFRPLAVVAR